VGCRLAGSWFAIVLISVCALAFGGAVILFDSYEFLGSPPWTWTSPWASGRIPFWSH